MSTLLASAGLAQTASAAEGDGSTAAGRVLSGSLLSGLDADVLAALQGAYATSGGAADDVDNGDLDVSLLSTLGLTVAGGVQLPLTIADIGVLGEYAAADSDGSAVGASGAVADDGTIGIGPADPAAPSAFTFDLADLLDPAVTSTIAGASLEVGAVSARAETDGTTAPVGSYDIAALRLALASPVLAGVSGSIRAAVDGAVDPVVDELVGPDGTIAGVLAGVTGLTLNAAATTMSLDVDLDAALDPLIGPAAPALGAGGPIQLDLGTGAVTVDIRALLEANGQDLNDLDPNQEVLSAEVLGLITEGVANLLDTLLDDVVAAVQTALNEAVLTVNATLRASLPIVGGVNVLSVGLTGTVAEVVAGSAPIAVNVLNAGVCALPIVGALVCGPTIGGTLLSAVGGLLSTTLLSPAPDGLLNSIAGVLQSAVLTPALGLLDPALENVVTEIVSLRANVQETTAPVAGLTFTETALRLTVLGFTGPQGAVRLDLASAAVGPADLTVPIVDALTPPRGSEEGGTTVTIDGSGFTDATGVTFGGVPATAVTIVSDTRITAVTPAGTAGPVDVVVQSADGDSAPLEFTYFAVTTVTDVTPDDGSDDGGTTVTITGSCFTGATAVLFGSTPAASFTVLSDTLVTAVTPAGTGLVDVSVTAPGDCGTGTLPDAFAFVAPDAPVISALDPVRGPELGGTPVTITGVGFTTVTSVTFDGIAADFTVVSDTVLEVVSPPHAPATVSVVVTSDDGASAPSDFTYFDVVEISAVSPATGGEQGGTTVTITGDCFTGATAVRFGTTDASSFTVLSDTQITAVAPAGTGTVGVTVVGLGDCGTTTAPAAFEYLAAPSVAGILPDRGPETGGTVVTITGTGFTTATGVTFDGVAGVSFSVDSDTQLTVTSPPHAPATVDLIVQSTAGASTAVDFTYLAVPAAVSITPDSGSTAGGTGVTITGSGFTQADGVTFDGLPGTAFTVVSDTVITVTTPAHPVGTVEVVVTGADGASDPLGFTYVAPPSVTGISPDRGPTTGGTAVTITGTGFTGASSVTFDGLPGTAFSVVSDTSILVTSPAQAVGPVDLVVQSPNGTSAPVDFTYLVAPSVTAIDPDNGPTAGGTSVTLTGSGFIGATAVTFDGVPGTSFSVVSDTSITVTTPPHAAGTVDVVVRSPLLDTAPVDFTYVVVTQVTDASPDSGSDLGGDVITLTGQCFTAATAVVFGTTPAASFTIVSDSVITAVTPAGTGLVDVTVVVPAPCGTATLPDGFAFVAADAPVVTGLAPDGGPASGGTVVEITGTGFTGATGVQFDGVSGTGFTVVSDTSIRVTSPAGTPGPANVVVLHPDGAAAPADFEYLAAGVAVLSGISPDSGSTAGGTTVTLTGSGFTGATGVLFGDTPSPSFTVISDTVILAVSPAGAAGEVGVVVRGAAGDSAALPFEFILSTTVTGGTPDLAPGGAGWGVTIVGSCFTGATQVLFGTTPATSFTVIDDSTIRAIAPAGSGTMSLTVVSPCGVFTLADGFSYPVTRPAGQVADGGSLAFTGSDPSLLALIAILLTLMGGAVIVRRRLAA